MGEYRRSEPGRVRTDGVGRRSFPLRDRLLRDRLPTVAAITALGALAWLFTWALFTPSLADRRWIVPGDFSAQFYPWASYVAQELAHGRLPLWNPYVFGGHPFQADPQTAVFYPVSGAIAATLGRNGLSYRELELELPIHFALAAIGTYLFVRRAGHGAIGAGVAAIAFGFGGFLTSYPAQQLAMLRTAVWLPWILLCIDLGLGGRVRVAWLVGAAAFSAIAVTAGHSQSAMFTFYLVLPYAIWRARVRGLSWRAAGAVAAGPIVLGLGLAAVQLAPTLEFVAISTRDRLPYDSAAYGYELKALPGALLPGWRGEKALYVGIAPLALAGLALGRSPTGWSIFWGAAALIGLLLSVGGNTFLYRVLYLLGPGWGTFRDQERIALVWSFAVAMLAARGTCVLRARAAESLRRWRRAVAIAALLAALFAVQALVLWSGSRLLERNPFDTLLDSAVFLTLVLALTAALVWRWQDIPARPAAMLLLGVVILDVFSVNQHNNLSQADPAGLLDRPAALAVPRSESELYRVRADDDQAVPPNLGMHWRVPFMAGDSPIQLRRTHDLLTSREEWRLWQLFNVKYLLSVGDRNDPGLEPVGRADDLLLSKVRFSLPRVWAVSDVRVVGGPAQALELVLSESVHPGDVAVVEDRPPLEIAPGLPRPNVDVRFYDPHALEVAIRSSGNALLVVADAWHPGWQAWIDGAPTPILRTNYAFRGVAVPTGDHTVLMRYRPGSLYVGAGLTAVSLLVSIGALWWGLRKERSAPRTSPSHSI